MKKTIFKSLITLIQVLILISLTTITIFAYPITYNTQGTYEGDTYGAYIWGFRYTPSFTYDSSTKIISSMRNVVINSSDCVNPVWNGTPCKIEVSQHSKSFTNFIATYKFSVNQYYKTVIGWQYMLTSIITKKYYTTLLPPNKQLVGNNNEENFVVYSEIESVETFVNSLLVDKILE